MRERALKWWDLLRNTNGVSPVDKGSLASKYFPTRSWKTLTGREIETIYLKEKHGLK